jgi:hypothetical protein
MAAPQPRWNVGNTNRNIAVMRAPHEPEPDTSLPIGDEPVDEKKPPVGDKPPLPGDKDRA